MSSYIVHAIKGSSTRSPKVARGEIRISTTAPIYFTIGSEPTADRKCALLLPGTSKQIRIPTSCLSVAVMAVDQFGSVSIHEITGNKASCSA